MLTDFDKLWDYRNPAATEEKFRALLPAAQERRMRRQRAETATERRGRRPRMARMNTND
jgi:hypothetical protein